MEEQSCSPQGRYEAERGAGETAGGQDTSFKHTPPGWQDSCMCKKKHLLKKRNDCPLTFTYIVWHVCVHTGGGREKQQQQQIRG